VVKAGKFPCAKMRGENEHAFAPRPRGQVVFQSLGPYPIACVFRRKARHAAKLDELPAKMDVDAAKDFFPGFGGEFRESQLEVALAHSAQAAKAPTDGEGDEAGEQTRHSSRHVAQAARYGDNQPILEVFPHRWTQRPV